jgi:hypothetical protein
MSSKQSKISPSFQVESYNFTTLQDTVNSMKNVGSIDGIGNQRIGFQDNIIVASTFILHYSNVIVMCILH